MKSKTNNNKKSVNERKKKKIIRMHHKGKSIKEISKATSLKTDEIKKILEEHLNPKKGGETKRTLLLCPFCHKVLNAKYLDKIEINKAWARDYYYGGRGKITTGRAYYPYESIPLFKSMSSKLIRIIAWLMRTNAINPYNLYKNLFAQTLGFDYERFTRNLRKSNINLLEKKRKFKVKNKRKIQYGETSFGAIPNFQIKDQERRFERYEIDIAEEI